MLKNNRTIYNLLSIYIEKYNGNNSYQNNYSIIFSKNRYLKLKILIVMEDNRNENKDRSHTPLGTEDYGNTRSGAGVTKEDKDKSVIKDEDIKIRKRAKLDGETGKFESENVSETNTDSDLPGAGEKEDIGTAASGAGLGGNKGRGTANSD